MENYMALPSNVIEYLNQKKQSLIKGHFLTSQEYFMRGYAGNVGRPSGEKADEQIMEMINEW
jgi:hypothetical protein